MSAKKLIQKLVSNNESQTMDFAHSFGKSLAVGDCIALTGNLGTGKTVISKAICKSLGYEGEVTSPTYSLVQEYPMNPPLIHLDLYRVPQNPDWDEIGIDHYLNGDKICLVEWAEKMEGYFESFNYWIEITRLDENSREISLYQQLN